MLGRSSVKVYFFVIFLLALWRIYHSKLVFKKTVFPLHAILTAILFLFGLAEYISFYLEAYGYDLRFLNHIINVYAPPYSVSTTSFLHTHNAKVIFGYIFSLLNGFHHFDFFDPGVPFLAFYPAGLILSHLCFFGAYVVISFFLLFQIKGRLNVGSYFGFGLALLVITKNLTDGGVLNGEFLLFGLPFYLFFGLRGTIFPQKDSLRSFIVLSGIIVFCYGVHSVIFWLTDGSQTMEGSDWVSSLTRFSLSFVIMSGASFLNSLNQKKSIQKSMAVFLAAVLFFSIIYRISDLHPLRNFYRVDNLPLPKDSAVVATGFDPQAFDELARDKEATIVQKFQQDRYLRVHMLLDQDTTYYDLSKKIGIDPGLGPLALVGSFCVEGNSLYLEQECWVAPFLDAKELDLNQGFRIEVSAPQKKRNIHGRDYFAQKIQLILPGCTPMLSTARLYLMKAAGIQRAICNRHPLKIVRIPEKYMLSAEND